MLKLPDEVVIAGAGIAGLAASIPLARAGRRVTVLEQRPAGRAAGYGIQITPNGSAVLRGLGVLPDDKSLVADGLEICSRRSGAALCFQPFGGAADGAWPHLLYRRSDLVDQLGQRAAEAGVTIHFGARVMRSEIESGGIRCFLADGSARTAPYLIAADGVHSPVCKMINGRLPERGSRYKIWRELVKLPQGHHRFPNIVRLTPGPRGHLVTYPICGGSLLNVVAVRETERTVLPSLPDTVARSELLREFERFPGVRDVLERCARPELWTHPESFLADTWFDRRAVLIGDALHPMLPFLAQGGSMALEDAWLLSRFLVSCGTLDEAHNSFRRDREARIQRVIRSVGLQGRLCHAAAAADSARGLALRALNLLPFAPLAMSMSWLVGHDVTGCP